MFQRKKLKSINSLGEILIQHREELRITVDNAAELLKLNPMYLRLLEKNAFKDLPADIYTINILKNYANLLKLNPHTVVEVYNKQKNIYEKTKQTKQSIKTTLWQKILGIILNPKLLKYSALIIILASILTYIGLGINKIISPPKLAISNPTENFLTSNHQINIIGSTEKEVNLFINDKPILIDRQGNFDIALDLQNGLNIIKVSARKKYSRENIIYRQIIVTE